MASESIVIELNKESDFDGVTPIALSRDDFTISGKRYYKANIPGPGGMVPADLFGLFSGVSPKLVGLASSSFNPMSVARIINSDAIGTFREEIDLTPQVQHVLMFPGDKLAILTKDGGRVQVILVVNELNEAETVRYALGHETYAQWRRFRIIRQTGVPFAPNLGTIWRPTFTFDPVSNLLVSTDNGTGTIPVNDLCLYPRHQGCYISIRYAGNGAGGGSFHIVEPTTGQAHVAETNLTTVLWSKVQFVSHDDMIALEASPSVVGAKLVVDIELARVQPGDRLSGRYARGL
jgi:hypothetical protein